MRSSFQPKVRSDLHPGVLLESTAEKSVTKSLIIIGVLVVGVIYHIFQWNEYSFAIVPLKAKEYTGFAEKAEFVQIASICKQRNIDTCTELYLSKAILADSSDKELLWELARIKADRKQHRDAVKLMAQYFKVGGTDPDARFLLAQALHQAGDSRSSKQHLQYLLYSSKKRIHPDVARYYVKVLMESKDWRKANEVILHFRKTQKNASYFLEKEFKEIRKHLS